MNIAVVKLRYSSQFNTHACHITEIVLYLSVKDRVKRKLWKDSDMLEAMNAVLVDKVKCATAAKHYNVPRKSLENRLKGRVTHGTNPGPATVLTRVEENSLVEYIKYIMCSCAFPMTKKICKVYAWAIAKRSGRHLSFNKERGPSDKWWRGFKSGIIS